MTKKRIAIIGVGVIGIPALTEILSKMANDFSITVYSFIAVEKKIVPAGVRLRCMPRYRIHQRLKYILLGLWVLWDSARASYSVLHAQSAFPGGVLARFLGKLLNIPWMVTLIGGEVEAMHHIPFGDLLNARLRRITYKVCAEAHILTVMSRFHAESVRSNLKLHRTIEVLPYAPTAGRLSEKEIALPVKLLHIAYHHRVKNHDMLLATAARLATAISFDLTIIGANYGDEFKDKVRELGLQDNIKIIGTRPHSEIEKFIAEAHILLHTSWYEGLPTVAFEAMAHGAVVCGTHVGIMADLSSTHCLTVSPGNAKELADAVVALINDPEKYRHLRREAHEWAASHDQRYYIDKMGVWYNQLAVDGKED